MCKKVIMEAKFGVATIRPIGSLQKAWKNGEINVDIGGFAIMKDGKNIPFDFDATSFADNEDGTYSYGNWDGRFFKHEDVDDGYAEEWANNGLAIDDITAEFLSQTDELSEFYFQLSDIDATENVIPSVLTVTEVVFFDENDEEYSIKPAVIERYNLVRITEDIESMLHKMHLMNEEMKDRLQKGADIQPEDVGIINNYIRDCLDNNQFAKSWEAEARMYMAALVHFTSLNRKAVFTYR